MLLELNFTLVLFAVSFLLFINLLNLTLYKPVGKIIEKRKHIIDSDFATAKELSEDANNMLESYTKEIKLARVSAHNIIQEVIAGAQKVRDEKVSVLIAELNKEKEIALKQIKIEEQSLMKQVEEKIQILTELITSKVLGSSEEKTLVRSH